ncbi:ATP synthase subunit I [Avibacterium paragallinarum]|uniref:ATP synthase subunit I n=1 Tax=Avibacterium paragallinarum TaxID=728 RepID=UPI00397BC696
MSAIIKQTKKQYLIALSIELLVMLVIFWFLWALQQSAVSFLLGFLASFVPYALFVWVMFFFQQKKNNPLTRFYRGGAIKFVCTIIFIVVAFKMVITMNYMVFFTGYFFALLLNNLLPFMVSKYCRI